MGPLHGAILLVGLDVSGRERAFPVIELRIDGRMAAEAFELGLARPLPLAEVGRQVGGRNQADHAVDDAVEAGLLMRQQGDGRAGL